MIEQPRSFGTTRAGDQAHLYTLTNEAGMIARLTDFGAALVELHAPGKGGELADVVTGFDSVEGYEGPENAKFGATVGPVANRIGGAKFTLDGQTYTLTANKPPNTLHSNGDALDKMLWRAESSETDQGQAITFTAIHPDGRAGFPGNVEAQVTYTLTHDNTLRITYHATTDKPTPINLTNHSYFNLAGHDAGRIGQHVLTLYADQYTPVDDQLIPTGSIESVKNTPLDFTSPKLIGDGLEALRHNGNETGYDQNFMVNPSNERLAPVAYVREPGAGRAMEVRSTQPAVQFFTAGNLKGQTGKRGTVYPFQSVFCLETQHPPDAVNHPNFPSTIVRPGETYHHIAEFRFTQGSAGA